jgi:excinuclease ABC subunit B
VLSGLWQGRHRHGPRHGKVDKPLVGANLAAHLDGLRTQMRKAAENLEFEEAARLRDEVKRLEAVELAIADDPLARQSVIEEAVGDATSRSGRSTAGRAGTARRRQVSPLGGWQTVLRGRRSIIL